MSLTEQLLAKNTVSLDSKIPAGPVADKWDTYKSDMKLVNPNNKRKFKVIVVGTGLAGASAAATLAELGYQVDAFTFHDSPRRAHSIAAQGGINAAKNYKGDGDSVHRLFYDTVKGGDFRAREANVHRLAQVSVNIIDQMVAQGVPFAREYGGLLDNRSFGGAQVSRTFYARGQTGQQLLLGAYQQFARQVGLGVALVGDHRADVVVHDPECEVEQVPDEEGEDDDPRPAHRAAREVGDLVVARALVLHRPRTAVQDSEGPGRVQVDKQHGEQSAAENPEHPALRGQRIQEGLEEVRVMVEVGRPHVHLEVADHVEEHEPHQADAGDAHRVLLADGGGVEVDEEGPALAGARRRPGDRASLARDRLCHVGLLQPVGPSGMCEKDGSPRSPEPRNSRKSWFRVLFH